MRVLADAEVRCCGPRASAGEDARRPRTRVLVDSARSAEPPTIVGSDGAERLHRPRRPASRGREPPCRSVEARQRLAASRARGSPRQARSQSSAPAPGRPPRQALEALRPTRPRARAPRSTPRPCARARRRGRRNVALRVQPERLLGRRASRPSPSGAPCAFAVSCACGARRRCGVRTTISDGRVGLGLRRGDRRVERVEVVARRRRAGRASRTPRSAAPTSSVKASVGRAVDGDVVVVVEYDELARARGGRRARPPRCETPSIRSPSRADGVDRSGRRSRGRAGCSASARKRSAIAMPTALAKPWPSGPGRRLDAGVWRASGWPGVLEPHWRNCFSSSSGRS